MRKRSEPTYIYAVKTGDFSQGQLRILHVKIGRTSNVDSTLRQYKRGSMDVELLNLWEANRDINPEDCERGVQKIAEKYAHKREGEKFIFIQEEKYREFSENVGMILKSVPLDEKNKPKMTPREKVSRKISGWESLKKTYPSSEAVEKRLREGRFTENYRKVLLGLKKYWEKRGK